MRCERCGTQLPAAGRGRIPRFCSGRCRVAAHRAKARVPQELTEARRWVRHERKRPITTAGTPASSTDPATWSTYTAAKRSTAGDGLGFALGDGFACIDLDHCLTGGRLSATAQAVLNANPDAYVEISPSGDGLHVWGRAPEGRGSARHGVEFYSTGRYITITGRVYRPGGLPDLIDPRAA